MAPTDRLGAILSAVMNHTIENRRDQIRRDAPGSLTIIVPCFNEIGAIESTVRRLVETMGGEIIVVDDGSTDGSSDRLDGLEASGDCPQLRVIHHSRNLGYGAAIKTGIRRASHDIIAIVDADGTYPIEAMTGLVEQMARADMVVGARRQSAAGSSSVRRLPKAVLGAYCSWLVGERIPDMNSGMRVFRREVALRYLGVLPDGFSLTTTLTVALMRGRYDVRFVPIEYAFRIGRSKIRPIRDTLGFAQLILRTGMYFAPLRVLSPVVLAFGLAFLASVGFDVLVLDDLTEKTALLLLLTLNSALFALLADMIDKRSRG